MSTFGTIKTLRLSTEAVATCPSILGNDSGTGLLAMTIDSCISILEICVSNVEDLLKQLVCQGNIGVKVTPPDASQSTGAAHTASMPGALTLV